MNKLNFGIIVLNYLAYSETEECIRHLMSQNYRDYNVKIVVVDNNSSNDSFNVLKKIYQTDKNIDVIKTRKNLGFAKGNNYGFRYLREKLDLDFVIVSNSDAYAKQKGLFEWIVSEYNKEKFGVLGPSIYSKRGNFFQSPAKNESHNIKDIHKEIFALRRHLAKLYFKKIIKGKVKEKVPKWSNDLYKKRSTAYTLHGAFQVFSKDYIKQFEDLYDSRTFLYREEDIVRLRCEKKNLPMVYSPEYKIEHLQAISTTKASKTILDQKIDRSKNLIASTKIYEKVLKESNLTE